MSPCPSDHTIVLLVSHSTRCSPSCRQIAARPRCRHRACHRPHFCCATVRRKSPPVMPTMSPRSPRRVLSNAQFALASRTPLPSRRSPKRRCRRPSVSMRRCQRVTSVVATRAPRRHPYQTLHREPSRCHVGPTCQCYSVDPVHCTLVNPVYRPWTPPVSLSSFF